MMRWLLRVWIGLRVWKATKSICPFIFFLILLWLSLWFENHILRSIFVFSWWKIMIYFLNFITLGSFLPKKRKHYEKLWKHDFVNEIVMRMLWLSLWFFVCSNLWLNYEKWKGFFWMTIWSCFVNFLCPNSWSNLNKYIKHFLIKNSCESWTFDDLYDLLQLETYDPIYEK